MVYTCCVTDCRGNYPGHKKVRLFSFPKDEDIRLKWISVIHRVNFVPTPHSKVCEDHFTNEDYVHDEEKWDSKHNKMIRIEFNKPKLKRDAVPSIFPDPPTKTSINKPLWKNRVDRRTSECDNNILGVFIKQEYPENDAISSLTMDRKCVSCGMANSQLFGLFESRYNGEIKEVYANMIYECFGIRLFDGIENFPKKIYMICEVCILRLRDALVFKTKIKDEENRIIDLWKSSQFTCREESEDRAKSKINNVPNSRLTENEINPQIKKEAEKSSDPCTVDESNMNVISYINENLIRCKICSEYFLHESELRDHMSAHMHELAPRKMNKSKASNNDCKNYICDVCNKAFVLRKGLTAHLETHNRTKLFQCKVCNKFLISINSLKSHTKLHDPVKKFTCDYCNKGYTTKVELKQHILSHMNLRNHRCAVCSKSFLLNKHLIQHMSTHKETRDFACHICKKNFKWRSCLNSHMLTHERTSKEFHCVYCKKSFSTKQYLGIHEKRHNGVYVEQQTFKCEICDKTFSYMKRYKEHVSHHNHGGRFHCDVCKKAFQTKRNLKIHMSAHVTMKNYTCNVCDKKFSTRGNLKYHTYLHSGEKPYSCRNCNRSFPVKSYMVKHTRNCIGDDVEIVQIKPDVFQ